MPEKDIEDLSLKSISDGDNSMFSDHADPLQTAQQSQPGDSSRPNEHSENESEELDDIELIFTTDETCRDLGLQEDLVSITETESWQHAGAGSGGQPVILKYTKLAEGESLVCNGEKSSVEEAISSQSSSIDREESVDRFDESSNTRLNKMWSQCSVLVETDISKCGVLEDADSSAGSSLRHVARRNTLAAPPTAYRFLKLCAMIPIPGDFDNCFFQVVVVVIRDERLHDYTRDLHVCFTYVKLNYHRSLMDYHGYF